MVLVWVSLVLASVSLLLVIPVWLTFRKMKPVMNRAFTIMGSLGKKVKIEGDMLAEVETGLKEGVIEQIGVKYPEVGILMAWMEENKPELFEKMTDHPEIIIALYQKYAPMIMSLIGGKSQAQQQYEL